MSLGDIDQGGDLDALVANNGEKSDTPQIASAAFEVLDDTLAWRSLMRSESGREKAKRLDRKETHIPVSVTTLRKD
jgi:hypothetical protein